MKWSVDNIMVGERSDNNRRNNLKELFPHRIDAFIIL